MVHFFTKEFSGVVISPAHLTNFALVSFPEPLLRPAKKGPGMIHHLNYFDRSSITELIAHFSASG